jgi:hypothetical protein
MLPVRLQAAQGVDQHGVFGREETGREHDGKLVGDREFLQVGGGLGGWSPERVPRSRAAR